MASQGKDLWAQRSLENCDILVEGSDGCLFPVHSEVLSTSSPYFEMVIWAGNHAADPPLEGVERQPQEVQGRKVVKLPFCNAATISELVKFIYSGCVNLHPYNVIDVYRGADFLCLDKLEQTCLEFYRSNINLSSSISLVQTEDKPWPDQRLEKFGWSHLLATVGICNTEEDLRAIDVKTLTRLVASDEFNAPREEIVWDLIISWANINPEERAKVVPQLALHLRIGSLPFSYVANEILEHLLMNPTDSACNEVRLRNLEANAMITVRNQWTDASQIGPIPTFMKPRLPYTLILLLGGRIPTGNVMTTTDTALIFDFHTQRWIEPKVDLRVSEDDDTFRQLSFHKLVLLGKDLYLLGGADQGVPSTRCDKLDLMTLKWSQIPSLSSQRTSLSATALENRLMVTGAGFLHNCTFTEFYDATNGNWTTGPNMINPRSSAGMVKAGQSVYVVGGVEGFRTLSSVEKFDLNNEKWSLVAHLNEPRRAASCVEHNGLVYVFGGIEGTRYLRTVERYDPSTDIWTFLTPMPEAKSQMASAILGEYIYIIGGATYLGFVSSVDVYHILENRWTRGMNLPGPRAGAAAISIEGLDVCSKLVGPERNSSALLPFQRIAPLDLRAPVEQNDDGIPMNHFYDGVDDEYFDSGDEDSALDVDDDVDESLVYFYWDSFDDDDDGEDDDDFFPEDFSDSEDEEDSPESASSETTSQSSSGEETSEDTEDDGDDDDDDSDQEEEVTRNCLLRLFGHATI